MLRVSAPGSTNDLHIHFLILPQPSAIRHPGSVADYSPHPCVLFAVYFANHKFPQVPTQIRISLCSYTFTPIHRHRILRKYHRYYSWLIACNKKSLSITNRKALIKSLYITINYFFPLSLLYVHKSL